MADETDIPSFMDEKVEETPPEVQEEAPEQEKEQKTVPHAALHEQRMINKQLQEELRSQREQASRMEDTFQKLLTNLNEKPQKEIPKYEDDPFGHFQARNETLEKELRQVSEKLETFTKSSSQRDFMQQINENVGSYEAEFRATHPDYDSALKYLKDVTRQDLADQGVPPAEIEKTLQAGKLGLANAALQHGKNPAEVIYERAKRYGYRPDSGGGDKMQTMAKGQALSKTVQGGSASGLTLRDLSQLPDDQIDAIVADESKFNQLIRGGMVR